MLHHSESQRSFTQHWRKWPRERFFGAKRENRNGHWLKKWFGPQNLTIRSIRNCYRQNIFDLSSRGSLFASAFYSSSSTRSSPPHLSSPPHPPSLFFGRDLQNILVFLSRFRTRVSAKPWNNCVWDEMRWDEMRSRKAGFLEDHKSWELCLDCFCVKVESETIVSWWVSPEVWYDTFLFLNELMSLLGLASYPMESEIKGRKRNQIHLFYVEK